MTRRKQGQRMLWEGVVNEDVRALWEPWMVEADKLLEDEELVDLVYEAQGERHEHSTTRGRSQTPAEMALRLLLLKHVRNWSFDTLEREVKMNLAYRDFTRIGLGKVPDAKTLARIAQALGGGVIAKLHERLGALAQEKGAVRGRKMRVDTTVVETNIHYPTDSSLLGDGTRVMTRTVKKIEQRSGGKLRRQVRDRMRSVNKRVVAIATASRHRGPEGEEQRKKEYRELLRMSRQILNDAKRVMVSSATTPKNTWAMRRSSRCGRNSTAAKPSSSYIPGCHFLRRLASPARSSTTPLIPPEQRSNLC
jgi:IS5 family transposase